MNLKCVFYGGILPPPLSYLRNTLTGKILVQEAVQVVSRQSNVAGTKQSRRKEDFGSERGGEDVLFRHAQPHFHGAATKSHILYLDLQV